MEYNTSTNFNEINPYENNLYPNEANNPVYQNEVSNTTIPESGNSFEVPVNKPCMRIKHISHLDLDGYGSTILTEILQNFMPKGYYEIETDNILPNRLNSIMKEVIDNLDY